MTVRELVSMGINVNYSLTEIVVHDNAGGEMRRLPSALPEKVKSAHVRAYRVDGMTKKGFKSLLVVIEERYIL